MQLNGFGQKAKLISKELNQVLANEYRTGVIADAVSFDKVLIKNNRGVQMKILSYRNNEGKLVCRNYIYPSGAHIQKNYKYGTATDTKWEGAYPYLETNLRTFTPKKDVVARKREIISTNIGENGKRSVTKSKLYQSNIKNEIPLSEYSGIGHYQNKKPANFYLNYLERNPDGDVIQRHLIHSKDNVSQSSYNNPYFYIMHYDLKDYIKNIFKDIVKKHNLADRNLSIKPAHMGFERGKSVEFGRYVEKDRALYYNIDCPMHKVKPFMLNIAEHESKHAWQYKEVELWKQGKLTGQRAKNAAQYDYELNNPISFVENEELYRKQLIEQETFNLGYDADDSFRTMCHELSDKFKNANILRPQMGDFS